MFTEDVQQETQLGTWTTASSQKNTSQLQRNSFPQTSREFIPHEFRILRKITITRLALRIINYQEYFQKKKQELKFKRKFL